MALIHLQDPFKSDGGRVASIILHGHHATTIEDLKGTVLTISGWGNTQSENGYYPEHLMQADMRVTGVIPDQILVLSQGDGSAACDGDSGGKIIISIIVASVYL